MFGIPEFFEKLARRRRLRILCENSAVVQARVFGADGKSEIIPAPNSLTAIDGMFGKYTGRVDVIGKNNDLCLVDTIRLR